MKNTLYLSDANVIARTRWSSRRRVAIRTLSHSTTAAIHLHLHASAGVETRRRSNLFVRGDCHAAILRFRSGWKRLAMTAKSGARGGRTLTVLPPMDFKSIASADSAIAPNTGTLPCVLPGNLIIIPSILKRSFGFSGLGRERGISPTEIPTVTGRRCRMPDAPCRLSIGIPSPPCSIHRPGTGT